MKNSPEQKIVYTFHATATGKLMRRLLYGTLRQLDHAGLTASWLKKRRTNHNGWLLRTGCVGQAASNIDTNIESEALHGDENRHKTGHPT